MLIMAPRATRGDAPLGTRAAVPDAASDNSPAPTRRRRPLQRSAAESGHYRLTPTFRRLEKLLEGSYRSEDGEGGDDGGGDLDGDEDDEDEDDEVEEDEEEEYAALSSSTAPRTNGTRVYTPMGECELCPHKWRVKLETDDEKIPGEYESCTKYGRRQQFEYTVLYQEKRSSQRFARSSLEYRPCRYTEQDEVYRMLRMQFICLLVGILSMRNVRRQRVVSASLFDQRRMRTQQSSKAGGGMAKRYDRKDSMETVELIPIKTAGKVPKSPAPDHNFEFV